MTSQMTSVALPARGTHLPALDGLRGIAILAVMCYHFAPEPDFAPAGALRAALAGAHAGWCGVDLFFVLSGFLITGILYDAKGARHFFRNFYMRRTLRIFPLYYGVLALFFVALPLAWKAPALAHAYHAHARSFAENLTDLSGKQTWLWLYGANIKVAIDGGLGTLHFFGPLWSLAVEEHFYLFWPCVVALCARRTLMKICVACAVLGLAVRVGCLLFDLPPVIPYVITPCRIDALAIGGFVALMVRGPQGAAVLSPPVRRWMAVGLPLLAILFLIPSKDAPITYTVGHSALALVFAALMLVIVGSPAGWIKGAFSHPVLRLFGKYSYGLYMFNGLIIFPLDKNALTRAILAHVGSPALAVALLVLLATGATLAVAMVSWHGFEKHFLRLKRFFPNGSRERTSGVPAPVPGALFATAAVE